MFVSSRLLQGVSVCCTAVVAFSGVRDRLSGNEAARAFGFLNGTLNIVPALAPLLGGLLAEAFGWRAPFWFLALYGLLVLVLIIMFLPETRPANTQPINGLPIKTTCVFCVMAAFGICSGQCRGHGHGINLCIIGTECIDG